MEDLLFGFYEKLRSIHYFRRSHWICILVPVNTCSLILMITEQMKVTRDECGGYNWEEYPLHSLHVKISKTTILNLTTL